ncbi:MAG TPA: hypothetical protein VI248_03460 [Kineosporiaceae bacterium]
MTVPRQRARHAEPSVPVSGPEALPVLLERLGGPDHAVRSTALRELVALADDHPQVRAAVVVAVCRYLRSPWRVEGAAPAARPPRHGSAREPDVRRGALGMLTARLRDPDDVTTWCGLDLDLSGAVLVGADFSGCWFTQGRVRFEGAWAVEGRMCFDGARFVGAGVTARHWTSGQGELSFRGARFSAGSVSLAGAVLTEGEISAAGAVVDGGTLSFAEVRLDGATLDLSGVTVSAGTLSLADACLVSGRVLLHDARMPGGLTTLRHVRTAAGVLHTAGTRIRPGSVDITGSREVDLTHTARGQAPGS